MNKWPLALSFAAGLLGGELSHYLSQPVYAQAQVVPPHEIRANSFVLINEKGIVLAKLSEERDRPSFKLFDALGREIWSVGGPIGLRTADIGR
jgi:hypothetical protein